MATLALSRDFVTRFAKLETKTQSKVSELAVMFRKLSAEQLRAAKGIHLERYQGQKDERARTIRIDSNHRGVVLDAGDNETFVLCHIDTHDNVDRWMQNNEFRVNEATGALELIDVGALGDAVQQAGHEPAPASEAIYAHRSDKEFRQLGVAEELVPALRAFTEEDQLQALLLVVPPGQAEALLLLLGDESVDTLYPQLAGTTKPDKVDTGDVGKAIQTPASKAQFTVISSDDELQAMLAQPLAQWRTYLHPSQREGAYKDTYNGPARVTGGAGTGKTVVAIHRAAYLAEQLGDVSGRPILFTTFTRNLAQVIERDLRSLAGSDVLEKVEVVNVDALARRIVSGAESASPQVAQDREMLELWQDAIDETGLEVSREFLQAEFEQVILAHEVASRNDYFKVARIGRGTRLDRRGRAAVWKAVERVTQELASSGKRTYLQLADDAAGYLRTRATRPYRHVIVDEAQDLHESQWRLLRAAVAEQPNDMFIVGDAHQRIYDRRTSLSNVGINIVGRSRRLRINYRTTHEILKWAIDFMGEEAVDDLDGGIETQTGATYHSFLHGNEPTMAGVASRHKQISELLEQIREWRAGGVPAEEIVVTARTGDLLEPVEAALSSKAMDWVRLEQFEVANEPGIRMATMHRIKGMEFRCVAVIDADEETIPLRWAVTSENVDELQHRADVQRERCLAYVAATRARDDLWVGWSGRPSPFLSERLVAG